MRYDEKLKGYQALLAELESGVNASIPGMPTTNIIGTCPTWVYQDAHRLGRHSAGLCYVPKSLENGIVFDCYGAAKAERMRLQAIDWLNGLISEGPPKPKLKWEESRTILATTQCRYECVIPFGLNCDHRLYIGIGSFVEGDSWVEVFLATNEDDFFMRPMRKIASLKIETAPDGGYPAPFLEAEEALHNLLSAALDALNNPKP